MSSTSIQCVVGLGNPGSDYADHRHNMGFWLLDRLAQQHGVTFRTEKKFHGAIARLPNTVGECWLLKPDTFMNQSGRAVGALAQFYKIAPSNILVVHDELDLPPGRVRLKQQGGHGGHNGLRDIIQVLGSKIFHRLRIGVGHPGHKDAVLKYVLSAPRKAETVLLDDALDEVIQQWSLIQAADWQAAMRVLHR